MRTNCFRSLEEDWLEFVILFGGGRSETSDGGKRKHIYIFIVFTLRVYFALVMSSPPAVSCVCPMVAITTVSRTLPPSELWQSSSRLASPISFYFSSSLLIPFIVFFLFLHFYISFCFHLLCKLYYDLNRKRVNGTAETYRLKPCFVDYYNSTSVSYAEETDAEFAWCLIPVWHPLMHRKWSLL